MYLIFTPFYKRDRENDEDDDARFNERFENDNTS